MRSNIARTESAGSVPDRAAIRRLLFRLLVALERVQESDERGLLLLGHRREGRHRRRRVLERAPDRARLQLVADVAQVRAWTVVAVLTDLVARQTAGLGGDELARLELRRDLHVDRVRRPGSGAEVRQVP